MASPTFSLPALADVSQASVADAITEASRLLSERFPSLDLRRGVLHDLLLLPHAELTAAHRQVLAKYLGARSLLDITEDPDLADTAIVDAVLSNWGVNRRVATKATGEVTIVVSRPTTVTVGLGSLFVVDGREYRSNASYTAKADQSQLNLSVDRPLVRTPDGRYAFSVFVTAVEAGSGSKARNDALVSPASPPAGFVTAYATSDFTGGVDAQTNRELIEELRVGIAARAPSNRINMQAMLKGLDVLTSPVVRSSVVGYGDPEMSRDRRSLLPVAIPGCVDWYVRSSTTPGATTIRLAATVTSVGADGTGHYQMAVDRNVSPGFYEIRSVRPLGASSGFLGTLPFTAEIGFDPTPTAYADGFVPYLGTPADASFSRFQTAVVNFSDDTTATHPAVGQTREYDFTFVQAPDIATLQDYFDRPANRGVGMDVLVRAPVPCFVRVTVNVSRSRSSATPDVDAIKAVVAAEVNATDFVGRLFASRLAFAVQSLLAGDASVASIQMLGRIRRPSGTDYYIDDDDELNVAIAADPAVGSRSVQFFADAQDVSVNVATDLPASA